MNQFYLTQKKNFLHFLSYTKEAITMKHWQFWKIMIFYELVPKLFLWLIEHRDSLC